MIGVMERRFFPSSRCRARRLQGARPAGKQRGVSLRFPAMTSVQTRDAAQQEDSLGALLESLSALADREAVTLGDVVAAFADRSSGVLVTLFGLIASIPVVGAIPGVSVATALLVLMTLAQELRGGQGLALPGPVARLSLRGDALDRGLSRVSRPVTWLDRHLGQRLTGLVDTRPARAVLKLCTAGLALAMLPLALVPGGVTPAAYGITAFGLALIARDGLLALAGYAFVAATVATGFWLL